MVRKIFVLDRTGFHGSIQIKTMVVVAVDEETARRDAAMRDSTGFTDPKALQCWEIGVANNTIAPGPILVTCGVAEIRISADAT